MPPQRVAIREDVVAAVREETLAHRAQREVRVLFSPFEQVLAELHLSLRRANWSKFVQERSMAWLPRFDEFLLIGFELAVYDKILARPA